MKNNTLTQRTADRLRHMIVKQKKFHFGEKLPNETIGHQPHNPARSHPDSDL